MVRRIRSDKNAVAGNKMFGSVGVPKITSGLFPEKWPRTGKTKRQDMSKDTSLPLTSCRRE